MSLIKYIGRSEKTIIINGTKKLLNSGQLFSGPSYLGKFVDFEILGVSKTEKDNKPVKVVIDDFVDKHINLNFLDEDSIPKVSICIVTLNNFNVIKRCLDSIEHYVRYKDYEILLCDTGSTDPEVIDLYNNLDPKKYTIFRNQKYNFSANNNLLAKHASGDALLFLNNDVFLTYDVVSEMVKYINCSNIGCVGSRLVWDADPTSIQHDGQVIFDNNTGNWIGPGHYNYRENINLISNKNSIVEGVTAACLMIRRKIFEKVNGFDEEYKDIYQDVDLNLKVYREGYDNFCIRERPLIHVDHSSRKGDATKDSPDDLRLIQKQWFHTGPNKIRKKVRHSILVCATNKRQLAEFISTIKSRIQYEFIFVNNCKNYMYSAEALNVLTEVSHGEILIYTHQDVLFKTEETFSKIDSIINKLGHNFGILGPAGVQYNGGHNMKGVDFSSKGYTFDAMKVHTLDEFCLITKRSNNLKFGEYLDHFHFYGADICHEAMDKGLCNYVVGIDIVHNSGGDGNLKRGDGYERYREQARKLYSKWGKKYPLIGTTTARFSNGYIYYFLGHSLNLSPVDEIIDLDSGSSDVIVPMQEQMV